MQETKVTRSMFLIRALERILSDKELKKSQNAQLRKACKTALDEIQDDLQKQGGHDEQANSPHTIIEADKYFLAFEMACKSKSAGVVGIALDCLQKMIAYGILVGNAPDSTLPGKRLIDRVIDTICNCFMGVQTDENVQLQIIKVLLTAVTSNNCEIHDGTILQAVRTCYNIYLASRSVVNQTTAKATLSQMLNVIFARMEAQANIDSELYEKIEQENESITEDSMVNHNGMDEGNMDRTNENSTDNLSTQNQDEAPESDRHQSKMIAETSLNQESGKGDENSSSPEQSIEKNKENNEFAPEKGETESENEQEQKQVNGISDSESSDTETMIRDIIEDMVSQVVINTSENQVERKESMTSDTSASSRYQQLEQQLYNSQSFSHVLQKDAFLVFRSLCKLSMKPLSEGPPDPKSHEHRSKILSLQLLLAILESSGPVFRSNEMFINAIKQYLCVALSKNGVSNIPEVFELSLAIFLKLLENFKTYLKMQIQVFFKEIFLNILETNSSSFDHKWMVLQTLGKICEDAQIVVDIYVNYDCDINAANIFEELVNILSKISHQNLPESNLSSHQENTMQSKSLECLVSILTCMVDWSKDLYVNPHSMSNLGKEHNPDGAISNLSLSAGHSSSNVNGSSQSIHSDSSSEHASLEIKKLNADNPETIEGIKQQKSILERGIQLFNLKPKKGVTFLQDQGMIGTTASDIAEFLSSEERLDPGQVGDFIGENEALNKEVMYEYVDNLNFSGMDFVPSLRMFLEGFRLPGEAQKIDRLMEKFASRFCDCNPKDTVFASADTAYVLAYSIIMLTTDLHSAQVKRKISVEDYIRMNKGINDSKDLPREYLEDIYEQIKHQEITLKSTRSQNVKGIRVLSAAQKKQEMDNIADTAKALMEAVSHVQSSFINTTHQDHVRPMFQLSWRSMLVAFSMGLQDSDESGIDQLCLEGMRCAIRIACIFQLPLERDTYVQALSRFSLLQANAGIREMKAKNIETIKTLINVAYTDGNYLQESWHEILQCISQLELLQLIGSKVRDQNATMKAVRSASVADANPILTKTFGLEHKKLASIQESMGETSSQSVVVAVDRIFTGSTRLDGDAIVDFVRWLSKVSLDELTNQLHPRMFCLQKIVEISYYNMGRIRIQWSRIWAILGDYFNEVGCSDEESIAFFAVDSLRQLSMKFLEKGELPGFSFQKDFLRPFEHIMKHHNSPNIQDMVVRCIAQMVSSQALNIKSGWKNIFGVFTLAASHHDENIVELAFHATSTIITDIFNLYFLSIIYCFQDAIGALREFSCCAFPDTSMEAIRLIRQCADYVAQRPDLFERHSGEDTSKPDMPNRDNIWVRGWFPILFELSIIISRCKLDVRTRGLTVMFEIMKTHGDSFHTDWWNDLFQIIFRIFDQMKVPELQLEKSDWFATTCNHALFAVCDVFTQYYETLSPTLLHDVYGQLLWCVEKENEQLARSGVNCLENLVLSNGTKFTKETWKVTCDTIQTVFKMVSADKLMTWKPGNDDIAELQTLQLRCILTAEMIECIDRILFYPTTTKKDDEYNVTVAQTPSMAIAQELRHKDAMFSQLNENHLFTMVRCLLVAHDFAKRFNGDNEQRTILWKAGFKGKSKPNLIRQECTSLSCTLRILFRMKDQLETAERVDALLYSVCLNALSYFSSLTTETHRDAWTPVLLLLITRTLRLEEKPFLTLTKKLHTPLCDLLLFELKPEVRLLLRRYFLQCNAVSTTSNS
ncbi:brefeldin A-inhibited guanine nucleotide-exchange protein 1-like [Styela clava]